MTDPEDELRRKLAQLENLRDVLGDAAVESARAKLEAELTARVRTGGGALMGDVTVRHGDVVGRDKWQVVLGDQYVGTGLDEVPREALLRGYYRALAAECRRLPLGIVDPNFFDLDGGRDVVLHEIYVDLDVVTPVRPEGAEHENQRAWGLRLARGEGEGRTPVIEALARDGAARVVLLGDPGSGKTTFVNDLTARLAAVAAGTGVVDLPEPLTGLRPVRLILREVAAHLPPDACGTAEMLWDAVRDDLARRLGEAAAERVLPHLQSRLLREGGLFLLDGLDEVPEAGRRRGCLLEAVQALMDSLPPAGRVVLTARSYAYADPAWRLEGVPVLALAPFDAAQVDRFVERWYRAVGPSMGWSPETAVARGEMLATALQERPRLGDLASRPLLLTLMATLHTSWGKLPEDRADLYEESVKLLLARWQQAREVRIDGERAPQLGLVAALGLDDIGVARTALERLAYEAHVAQGEGELRDEAPADIPLGRVLAAFAPLLPDDVNPRRVLTYLETRAGLLLGRREGVYAFPHRSFQEYLAACHLADASDFAAELRNHVWDDLDWWREVFLLGVGKAKQGGLGNAVHVVNTLVPEGPDDVPDPTDRHRRAAILAGEALLDLDLVRHTAGHLDYAALVRRVRRWLRGLIEAGCLAPRERLEAGDILGRLGDPRPGVGVRVVEGREVPDIVWVEIPAGPFLMGSPADEEEASDHEKSQHELHLPRYYIARYPVTNAQFRPFVAGGGYDNPAYWTEQGWTWRNGAEPDLSVYDDFSNEEMVRNYREWLTGRPAEKRDRPFWWGDRRRGAPTRPVVGVTWHEVVAYARWLAARLRDGDTTLSVWAESEISDLRLEPGDLRVWLPSEAEWEKAARGTDGRRYPWGDWEAGRANTEELDLGETNPVGIFPAGRSPYGVQEMAGNVWEWTRSRWGEQSVMWVDYGYPYVPDDGRERLEDMRIPILRGGSWGSSRGHARCAVRSGGGPDGFGSSVGFRVVVSLACSDS